MPSIVPGPSAAFKVTALENSAGFGAVVEGIDINKLEEGDFLALERALYTHKLVVIKGQEKLVPASQLALVQRFDPKAPKVHGHGTAAEANKVHKGGKKALVGANPGVPECDHVRMLGKAVLPVGHFGVTEPLELKGGTHTGFHKDPLSPEKIEAGQTRAQRWHIDAAFYRVHPPRVTSLWHMKLPTGPDLTLRWDDGSGTTMTVPPGRTAFIDCTRMYNQLSDENKAWVDHSEAEYAPSPYQFIANAKAYGNGFNLYSEGLETPYEDLPSAEREHIKTYPLVWINPYTGEKALSVHGIVVRRLHLRTEKDGPVSIIDDLAAVREKLYQLQRPYLEPENVLMSPVEEGDLLIWWNRGLRHTAMDYPSKEAWGERICHQVHVAGSDNPAFPERVQT